MGGVVVESGPRVESVLGTVTTGLTRGLWIEEIR